MCNTDFINGIIVAFIGGAIGGIVIWLIGVAKDSVTKLCDTKKVEKWLKINTLDEIKWRSTRAIASHNNLPEDRVRYICSYSKKIQLNTKDSNESKELWKIRHDD